MAKAMSLEAVPYVLKFEREVPEGERSTFYIRPLDYKERAKLQDGTIVTEITPGPKNELGRGMMHHLIGSQQARAVEMGIVKIENLRDAKNDLIKYEEGSDPKWKGRVLSMLNPEWVSELSAEILRMSGLTRDEEKN